MSAKLPGFSGFDFINKLCDPNEIILITEKPQDAHRVYDLGILDCIAPPFNVIQMKKSVARVIFKINSSPEVNKEQSHIIEIKHNLKSEKIPTVKIKWIEVNGRLCKIITPEKNIWFYLV